MGLISDLKGSPDRTKEDFFLIFSSIFSSAQPALMLGIADLRYNRARLRQNARHISYRVELRIKLT